MSDARSHKRPRTEDATDEPEANGATHDANEGAGNCFVGSIDQGTTSTRFLIFSTSGEPVASHQMGFENIHPHSG